jgi:hypothetical protein
VSQDKRAFYVRSRDLRMRIAAWIVDECPEGWAVVCSPPTRNLEQNARFHAMCGDFVKSGFTWAGKKRTTAQVKVLMVSGHAHATKEEFEMVPGLEGEFVNLRESTALMSVRRSSSLIEYTRAYGDSIGIVWSETEVPSTA